MKRWLRAGVVALFVLVSAACTSDVEPGATSTPPTASASVVPLTQWVDDVCQALQRYNDSPPAKDAGPSDAGILASIDDMIADLDELRQTIENAGVPDIEGGQSFANQLVAELTEASEHLRGAKSQVNGLPEGDDGQRLQAFQDLIEPALVPVLAISLLLEGDRADLLVTLTDPVRTETVDAAISLASADPAVTEVEYWDKAKTCERFRELQANDLALSAANVDCSVIPASVRVVFSGGVVPTDTLAADLRAVRGVKDVIERSEGERPFFEAVGLDVTALSPLRDQATRTEACVGVV